MKIKINDDQTCKVTFEHLNGGVAKLTISRNPLTGDWLQQHEHHNSQSAYYGDKASALSLANKIVATSATHGLECNVEITPAYNPALDALTHS